jgi:hypothetical protein
VGHAPLLLPVLLRLLLGLYRGLLLPGLLFPGEAILPDRSGSG